MTWIQTASGRKVDPLDLCVEDICIEDIAHSLAHLCRFTGHVKEFYSVAQHSVYVSHRCAPQDALFGLLHDASEAYLTDIPRPLKYRPEFAFYREAEDRAMFVIASAFNLTTHITPPSVTEADNRILASEARDLMSPLHPEWRVMAEPYERRIYGWGPDLAKQIFLDRFYTLQRQKMEGALKNERSSRGFVRGGSSVHSDALDGAEG